MFRPRSPSGTGSGKGTGSEDRAAATGLAAAALSRGLRLDSRNDGPISRRVVEGLVVRGLDLPYPVRFPQSVHSADLVAAATSTDVTPQPRGS